MFYLSPDDENFAAMMPGGDLAAVRTDGSEVQLISYGMTLVNLQSNYGNKLQLADGKPATLNFPVPEKFKNDTPSEIPLWSFNESTGLWEEEGKATYDASTQTYVGTVTHFSWVNLDYPESRSTLKVVVKDEAGNVVPNVCVDIDGQRNYFTNVKGEAELYVPINTAFYVKVHSEDYSNYSPEVKVDVDAITTAGTTKTVNITLPTLAHISGKVVNSGKGNSLSTLWIEYNGKSTKRIHNDATGQFYMNAPADYTGAAKLKLRASDGSMHTYDITLDGKDHAYTFDIKTDEATGGTITYTPSGESAKTIIVPPVYYEDMAGVSLVDNHLSYNNYGSGSLTIDIDGYSESTTSYSNVKFYFYNDGISGECANGTATVTKNEYGNMRFQISGTIKYGDWSTGSYVEKTASVKGDFTAPLLGKGKGLKNISTKSSEFPSITPWLNGKSATLGLQITESERLGTGVLLWYFNDNLNYSDYLNLKNQAKAALGDPVAVYDGGDTATEDWSDMCMAYFYKDGRFIMVSYCPWRQGEEEYMQDQTLDFNCLFETHAGRIQVHVLENMNIDYTNLLHMRQ